MLKRIKPATLLLPVLALLAMVARFASAVSAEPAPYVEVDVFHENHIHFTPDQPDRYDTAGVVAEDNGRVIVTSAVIPAFDTTMKITARLALHPIPKDIQSVHDKWDRAGNVRLCREGEPDIEVVKFVTAYGGFTEFEVDVTHLAPLLKDTCTFRAFIDTWVSPAWKIDFSLSFEPDEPEVLPVWVGAVVFEESFDTREIDAEGIEVTVEVPESLERVTMNYLVSGHCTDGRGADEFEQKDNVIYIDGHVVYRFRPWRDDCRQFREVNPYCRRWSNGWWSSDFSRSGWCPGDFVAPVELDLTDHLTPGRHTIRFVIENMRPVDEDGNYGYWRVSSHLVGWEL